MFSFSDWKLDDFRLKVAKKDDTDAQFVQIARLWITFITRQKTGVGYLKFMATLRTLKFDKHVFNAFQYSKGNLIKIYSTYSLIIIYQS